MSRRVNPILKSGDQELQRLFKIISIEIVREVNRIPSARIELFSGKGALKKFAASENKFFELGAELSIELSYLEDARQKSAVFKGLITRHTVESGPQGNILTLELKDKAVIMTRQRKSVVYDNGDGKTIHDHEIIEKILKAHQLEKGALEKTAGAHEKMVQYYCTDWDFIVTRAEANGRLVSIGEDGKVNLLPIDQGSGATIKIRYPIDSVFSMEMEADACAPYEKVETVSYDLKNEKLIKSIEAKDFDLAQKGFEVKKTTGALGGALASLSGAVKMAPQEQKAWAEAFLAKSRMAMYRGVISKPGDPNAKVGHKLQLEGVGKRFEGGALITGVRHTLSDEGWVTDLQFGLSKRWFADEAEDLTGAPAAGLLPAIQGLHLGKVTALKEDPDFRIQVRAPAISGKTAKNIWARFANPYAGEKHGFFFKPEIGDEVVIGFLNDDPRQAIVLGSLYSSKIKPPDDLKQKSQENIKKGIVTPSGFSIIIDEKAKKIEIRDAHKNVIIMDKDGIALNSEKDLKINAKGAVKISGKTIDLK